VTNLVTMRRSVSSACVALLIALAGAFTLTAPVTAAPAATHIAQQQTDPATPTNTGPDIQAPQQPDTSIKQETKNKLWIGGIAILLFAFVYWRNKRRYSKWRKARKAG
jgi:hypothetical protein